ncbi:uncharacterized protein LOC105433142 [Pogonomyrmex barbatus]|uniref:Uncharacterized protein LOC105433142 n=1 Tax=Pogonomyrmex barbatus TaxID=144034 RepID=A0A6I9WRS3_9HYME|nr:uncharacterized protein LOC105433142 [Pogonomyrmex barbatus]
MTYLGMAFNAYNWIMSNNTKNIILHKTVNLLQLVQYRHKKMLRVSNNLLQRRVVNGIREDMIISLDNVIRENEVLRIGIGDVDEYDIDNFELIAFYNWQSKLRIRKILMNNINTLMSKIYCAFIKRYSSLYFVLTNYCKKATSFLRNNRKLLKSSKIHRKEEQNSCCKYHFLKQLISYCNIAAEFFEKGLIKLAD